MQEGYLLLTGASSGIGKILAIELSKKYRIILHGRNEDRLKEVMSLCSSSNHLIWKFDLNNITEIEQSLKDFIQLNKIEINQFVHCAGFMKMVPLKMSTVEILMQTFNTNVFAASLITRTLIQKKINNSAVNSIVFISSNISNMGAKAMSAYGASKGAIDTLMRCLAVELGPKVRVNSVLPGAVITEMTKTIFEDEVVKNRMSAMYPLGIGEPLDIFLMVDFLLSSNAKWITGQQFTVDGGRSINITG